MSKPVGKPWFRMHTDVLENPKVRRMRFAEIGGWALTLAVASKHGGVLPSLDVFAWEMRISEEEAQKLIDGLVRHGLLDITEAEGNGFGNGTKPFPIYSPHDWGIWQYVSDVSTDRVRALRERRKIDKPTKPRGRPRKDEKYETVSKRSGNVSETYYGTVSGTSSETETETDIPHSPPTGEYPSAFLAAWDAYGGVGSKKAALTAWLRRTPLREKQTVIPTNVRPDVMLAKVREYRESCEENGRTMRDFATWLNNSGWEEEWSTQIPAANGVNGNGKNGAIGKKLLTPTPEWANGKPVVFAYDGVHVRYMGDPEPMRRNIEDGKIYNP